MSPEICGVQDPQWAILSLMVTRDACSSLGARRFIVDICLFRRLLGSCLQQSCAKKSSSEGLRDSAIRLCFDLLSWQPLSRLGRPRACELFGSFGLACRCSAQAQSRPSSTDLQHQPRASGSALSWRFRTLSCTAPDLPEVRTWRRLHCLVHSRKLAHIG